jgi:hypothetical protein
MLARYSITVAAIVSMACVRPRPTSIDTSVVPDVVHVTVTNSGWPDATIYAYNGGQRIRVGFVPGGGITEDITVPRRLFALGRAQLYVQLVGTRDSYLFDEVPLDAGDRVMLRITRTLPQSTLISMPKS